MSVPVMKREDVQTEHTELRHDEPLDSPIDRGQSGSQYEAEAEWESNIATDSRPESSIVLEHARCRWSPRRRRHQNGQDPCFDREEDWSILKGASMGDQSNDRQGGTEPRGTDIHCVDVSTAVAWCSLDTRNRKGVSGASESGSRCWTWEPPTESERGSRPGIFSATHMGH